MRSTSADKKTLARPGLMLLLVLSLALTLIKAPGVVRAQGPQYTFTKIADTRDDAGLEGTNCVGLSNLGTVIVYFRPTGSATVQLWRGDGQPGSFRQIAPDVVNQGCPSINDLDETAYQVQSDPAVAVITLMRNTNGTLTPLASSNGTPPLIASSQGGYNPLSYSGSAAFVAGTSVGAGIYVAPAGFWVYNPLTDPALSSFRGPRSINDSNTVAFVAKRPDGPMGIYRGSAVPLIEDGDTVSVGTISIHDVPPAINNAGMVAFVGNTGGGSNVYTTSDGDSVTLVGTALAPEIPPIAINDEGTVAFRRNTAGGNVVGEGLYVGRPGSIDEKVIAYGDPLDDSTFEFGFLWEEAINDSGQIAFFATLANGRRGVYRANPIDTAPVVTAPAPIVITATEASGATGNGSALLAAFLAGGSATDNADPNPMRLPPQLNGVDATNATLFPLGTSTVTFRFQDASGNVGTATSQVTVQPAPKSGKIGDFVWRDFNKNGLQDPAETGIAGVVVNLSGAATVTTTTNAGGYYEFTGLGAGDYTVTIPTAPAGLVATTSNVGGAAAGNNSNGSPAPVTLATNASVNLAIDFGYIDKVGPTCAVYASASPPYMTYKDNVGGSGIVKLEVTVNLNNNYRVVFTPTPSAFTPALAYSTTTVPLGGVPPAGQIVTFITPVTAPTEVKVAAYRISTSKSSQLAVKATDQYGNSATCDPVETTVTKLKQEKGNQIFSAIPYDEHIVTIENGNPGLRALDVVVNGVEFKVKNLPDGATKIIDVKSAMHRRRDNVIELVPRGKRGDTADVTIGPEQP